MGPSMMGSVATREEATVDVLSDVLSWIRVEGTLSRRSELSAPWGISYPPNRHFSFMVVEAGSL